MSVPHTGYVPVYVVAVEASVVPSKVRPEPTTSDLIPPMLFPTRMPPRAVVEPVPPYI